ncbi:hypothetical protein CEXT_318481 [Caerostris extrusa]|uniref:Uncharacterized protein n=1 Tax=Caerostris extrusa TaxID=172846 RepID=A0AAV4R5L1_CAEEX|nr:hypothetical protein CEXT_318481 [Caerostris extrusa]
MKVSDHPTRIQKMGPSKTTSERSKKKKKKKKNSSNFLSPLPPASIYHRKTVPLRGMTTKQAGGHWHATSERRKLDEQALGSPLGPHFGRGGGWNQPC